MTAAATARPRVLAQRESNESCEAWPGFANVGFVHRSRPLIVRPTTSIAGADKEIRIRLNDRWLGRPPACRWS